MVLIVYVRNLIGENPCVVQAAISLSVRLVASLQFWGEYTYTTVNTELSNGRCANIKSSVAIGEGREMALNYLESESQSCLCIGTECICIVNDKRRMKGDLHVWFCEKFEVPVLLLTQLGGR